MVLDRLYAVLVNYRSWALSASCARMLADAGIDPSHVVVVDNASDDGSRDRLTELLPRARLVASQRNLGFAAAVNWGTSSALEQGAAGVVLINSDVFFETDFLEALVGDRQLEELCVGPEIYELRGPDRPWFVGAWSGALPGTITRRRPGDRRTVVDFLWACCLVVGREVWKRVGPFDPDYFLFYEDMDWCRRARAAGVVLRISPEARLWHAVGGSTGGSSSPIRRYHMARSMVIFHERWGDGPIGRRAHVPLALKQAAALVSRAEWRALRAHLSGYLAGLQFAQARTSRPLLATERGSSPAAGYGRPTNRG